MPTFIKESKLSVPTKRPYGADRSSSRWSWEHVLLVLAILTLSLALVVTLAHLANEAFRDSCLGRRSQGTAGC